jgi:Zn-dependent alcohol dehydrogenase
VVSQNSCVPIEADIPFEVAALTGCGVPTGWGTAVYAASVRAGQTVVIFGAGGVGSNAVQGARYAGAANVIVVDPVAFKRENALAFGATRVFASAAEAQEAVIDLPRGQLADHALITIGVLSSEVVDQAAAIVGKGCQVTITSVGRSATSPGCSASTAPASSSSTSSSPAGTRSTTSTPATRTWTTERSSAASSPTLLERPEKPLRSRVIGIDVTPDHDDGHPTGAR